MVVHQRDVLLAYLALCEQREDWRGKLLFIPHLDNESRIFALAGSIAGAAVLALTESADTAKTAMRANCCDFVVNTLDEAVRILKNEVRKQAPVTVALICGPAEAQAEMEDRGLVPDAFAPSPLSEVSMVRESYANVQEKNLALNERAGRADKRGLEWIFGLKTHFSSDLVLYFPASSSAFQSA